MPDQGERGVMLDSFEPDDAAALCAIDHDLEHRRRFDFPEDFVPSLRHSAAVIARWADERRSGVRFPFAVRETASGDLIGGCELSPTGEGIASISYWTHPLHRGRGVASDAVRQVCSHAFTDLGFHRLELEADPDNVASHRVAVRSGFREIGLRASRVLYVLEQRR